MDSTTPTTGLRVNGFGALCMYVGAAVIAATLVKWALRSADTAEIAERTAEHTASHCAELAAHARRLNRLERRVVSETEPVPATDRLDIPDAIVEAPSVSSERSEPWTVKSEGEPALVEGLDPRIRRDRGERSD